MKFKSMTFKSVLTLFAFGLGVASFEAHAKCPSASLLEDKLDKQFRISEVGEALLPSLKSKVPGIANLYGNALLIVTPLKFINEDKQEDGTINCFYEDGLKRGLNFSIKNK